jgi:hypothetical protein
MINRSGERSCGLDDVEKPADIAGFFMGLGTDGHGAPRFVMRACVDLE